MSKYETHAAYPASGLAAAQTALLTLWPSFSPYHQDLVLVGGLAVHYLTRHRTDSPWPGVVTTDVDFGIELSAENGQYGSVRTAMEGLGFHADAQAAGRLVRQVENMNLYVDFLTEAPPAITGTRRVDDVLASVFPGINRALAARRMVTITGQDIYGATASCDVAMADIGPLLVLKINAFGGPTGRQRPKDAYDVLQAVTAFVDGPQAAIAAFHAEAGQGNTGYETACQALRRYFIHPDAAAPARAAAFLRAFSDDQQRIREDLVSTARFLLGE
ncbi:nucleotidyl transferase AbiEii/AbiGii toxin family protein [Prosthecobacter sp.]|uniref:nucleotidyl transferase AbiEii/AbiGii toxin family protein n=1 Tax=Prosthecobacter sp. TaxID=1965333 RepID=UPI003782D2C2